MILSPALHVLLLAVSILTTTALAGYAWRHRTEQGVISFGGLMVSFTLYSGAHLIGLLTVHPTWRLVWENLQWTGLAIVPLFWLLFAMEYTGYDEMLTRRTVGVLAVAPLVTILLAWTNPWHGLMWTENTIVIVSGLAILRQPFGPWAVAFTGITYGMVAVGIFLLLRLIWLSDHLYTSQAVLLIIGAAGPIVANVLTVLGLTPSGTPPLDMTPYAFSITGLAFGYALFRHRLFDLVPAAHQLGRDAAIRDLEDGVVIVDTDREVIYCNPAAVELLDREPTEVLGSPVRSLVDDSILDFDAEDSLAELEHDDRIYEVRSSPIRNRRDDPIGYTLIVQDITERKRRERQLTRQRDELARLDKLNAVNQALVSATSRAGIEEAVCDRLAEPELYRTVCVADIPTWSGDADRWTVATANGELTKPDELPSGEFDLQENGSASGVEPADGRHEAWTVVPLAYGRTVYGALGLQPGEGADSDTTAVTDREREVLGELGELIGHAINAVESRQLLTAESVIKVDLQSEDIDGALLQAASQTGCRLEISGIIPCGGEGHITYVRVEDGSAEDVADALGIISGTSARRIRDEGSLVEWTVTADTLIGTLIDHGAHVLRAIVDDGIARFEIELAAADSVRELLDDVRREFSDTRVVARRTEERPIQQADTIPRGRIEELTDRQQEALEAAYRAGYYTWPRDSTAEEIAETLDITAPTLHAHLRKAENSLFAELFDQ